MLSLLSRKLRSSRRPQTPFGLRAADSRILQKVRARQQTIQTCDSSTLREMVQRIRQRLPNQQRKTHRLASDTLIESLALISEGMRRVLGKEYYDVQMLAGLALIQGHVAQMQTGEGKTITAAIPAFVFALFGQGVHVATTNSYLAQRDSLEVGVVLQSLGLSVGLLPEGNDIAAKRSAYLCDVTYGTGYEFGFDLLRDQISKRRSQDTRLGAALLSRLQGTWKSASQPLQRARAFAIVDEADSVLIDEATMPLVLSSTELASAPPTGSHTWPGGRRREDLPSTSQHPGTSREHRLLKLAHDTAMSLLDGNDIVLDAASRRIDITTSGWEKLHQPLRRMPQSELVRPWSEYVRNAVRAHYFLQRDEDYAVIDGKVQIVDQHTGRIHDERSWQSGLHQAVEFKEGVALSPERRTEAQVSRQRYFQTYQQLCGMTGTATGTEAELRSFYHLDVSIIPTHRPVQRQELPERFFVSGSDRDAALVREAAERAAFGQPVLVGTRTIAHSLRLSELMTSADLQHTVLNGVQTEQEASIVVNAGRHGQVTIATNMAGRGTDIKPDQTALDAGGLLVLAAEHHTSERVDRQLIGRCGRQGQPGGFRFYSSADDEVFRQSKSDVPEQIRASADAAGECHISLKDQVLHIQRQLDEQAFQKRISMVQRDSWMEDILQTLAGES